MGFGKPSDQIVFHAQELLILGLRAARQLSDAGYAPPPPARDVIVAGRTGIANLEMMLVNMHAGRMISDHDYRVAKAAATALCGGDIEAGSRVDEAWLITIERAEFMTLLKTPETQARIQQMLETGKPLRN
jgi:3-hydroxyacyl-CoA dehydrogenase